MTDETPHLEGTLMSTEDTPRHQLVISYDSNAPSYQLVCNADDTARCRNLAVCACEEIYGLQDEQGLWYHEVGEDDERHYHKPVGYCWESFQIETSDGVAWSGRFPQGVLATLPVRLSYDYSLGDWAWEVVK